jgi:hypothetical protein
LIRQRGLGPGDLLVAERPEPVMFYFGRAEFYLRPYGFERYTYQAPDGVRNIYTNSLLLSERRDWKQLVEAPHAGRRAWLIGGWRLARWTKQVDPRLWDAVNRSADQAARTDDDWSLIRVRLPLRG